MNTPVSVNKRGARILDSVEVEDNGWMGSLGKFVVGAILGEVLAVMSLFTVIWCGLEGFWNGFGPSVLSLSPILFGVFGIVWFDQVIMACRRFVEWFHTT